MEKQLLESLRDEVVAAPRDNSRATPKTRVRLPSFSPDEVIAILRQDRLLYASLVSERDRADEADETFWVVLLPKSAVTSAMEPGDAGEAERLKGKSGHVMTLWRGSTQPEMTQSDLESTQPLFRYPADRRTGSFCALEQVFFRPTPGWKRACDLVGATIALTLLSPLLLVVTLLIKLGSPGPAIFRQRRLGAAGKPFTIWKFRTFRQEVATAHHQSYISSLKHSNRPLRKVDTASRLIPCGHLLRACAIDELPQLFNVWQGTMSLVGPRPDVLDFDDYTSAQRRRFDVVPGMTGLWQVSGKNKTTFNKMIDLDVRYVEKRSLWLDLWIMLMTPPAMVRQLVEEDSI